MQGWHRRMMRLMGGLSGLGLLLGPGQAAVIVTFDDLPLAGENAYWNGADGSGGWVSQGVHFGNEYDATWQSWSGFAYSTVNDPDTPGWENQYAVSSGTGYGGSGNYAVVYDSAAADVITLLEPAVVLGFYVNNTTYAALSMRDGDPFAKQFGGPTGADPDWFKLTITAGDTAGGSLDPVVFYLADFRPADPADDYIVTDWRYVDLSAWGVPVRTIGFDLSSSDVGSWGMNTPRYFAMDHLTLVPEPASGLLLLGGILFAAAGRLAAGLRNGRKTGPAPGTRTW